MASPWQGLSQKIQKFLWDQQYRNPKYEIITAMLEARAKNITVTEQDVETLSNGKNRTFKIMSYPIDPNSVAANCTGQSICTPGAVAQPEVQLFTLSQCISSNTFTIHSSDLRLVDDGNASISDHALAQIASKLGALRKQLAYNITSSIYANAGTMLDGNPTSRVTMTNSTTGVIQPIGMWDIEKVFADGGFTDPYIVGSTEVFQWRKALEIATNNNTTGQDYAKLGGKGLYYDVNLNAIGGDLTHGEHILAFDPQSLKFVTYSKNVGIFATDLSSPEQLDALFQRGTTYLKGAIYDYETSLVWDFYARYDECLYDNDGGFNMFFQLNWDIFYPKMQTLNINSVNGIFHFRTCPVLLTPCPSGDTPSPAITPNTYTSTPGLSYPGLLYTITANGVSTQPDATLTSIDDLVAQLNLATMNTVGFVKASSTTITYTGYKPMSVVLNYNGASVTLTFA
jgi:hypothetical protein